MRSHPAWGAWIEIRMGARRRTRQACRTPHGVRGLKSFEDCRLDFVLPSHPSRVRGLKCLPPRRTRSPYTVAPLAGAWIEIACLMA